MFLVASAIAATASASDLKINGVNSASVPLGGAVSVELTGGANLPALVFADLDPGPTTVLGESVALAFSPSVVLVAAGMTNGSGLFSIPGSAPNGPSAIGATFHVLGLVVDGGDPNGADFSNGASLTLLDPAFAHTELAGHSLSEYPHFEFVRSFNVGGSIEIAVDPLLNPAAAGATGDLYITANKSAADWASDPSLVDATSDGVETVVFHPTDYAANRFTVDTGTLPDVSGTEVGEGYDVVVDLDQDGQLSAGDLIDGYGSGAGLWVVRDTTQPGPYTTVETIYSLGSFLGQDLYYPSNVASLGELPLVIVSHGNGHNYQWYDHIGEHLASYGFIVMSHQNNTQPGIETASTTTLNNTDQFLGNLDTIAGGVLDGHVNDNRIFWIGHSRGGEGVTRAYDRIIDGTYVPNNYVAGDIVLISSIAPTDFLGTNSSNPHDKPYHLWVGSSDADVNGCASNPIAQSFPLHDRAENQRQAIALHGAGHGDFHDGGGSSVASGPCLIGRSRTHDIMRGYLLPLYRYHLNGDPASKDFLWRQWEAFQPIGAPDFACVFAQLQFREGTEGGKFVIDDFQTEPSTAVASSGIAVSHDLDDFTEGRLDDNNSNFTDNAGDAFNGFTYGRNTDSSAGIVFSHSASDRRLTYSMPSGVDWSNYGSLSFRAGQGSRHPLTTAIDADQLFDVRLSDGSGNSSTISIGAYGAGLEELYQRSSCGIGLGWAVEMETIRMRLRDFQVDGSGLDLTDITELEFLFGPSHGQDRGRIGMDDIELVRD